jgi:hypothetical protein
MRVLAPGPGGGALFEEGLCAFGFVLSSAELTEEVGFEAEGGVHGEIGSATDGFETGGDGERGLGGDGLGELPASGEEVFGRYDFIDEANAERLGGIDDLAGDEEFEGGGGADDAGEALRTSIAGEQAELDFGLAEAGLVTGDAEVTGEGELAASTKSEAIDESDDGFAAGLDEVKDGLSTEGFLFPCGAVQGDEFVDVGSGGEGFVSCSGDKDDANGRVVGEGVEGGFEFVEDLRVQSVEDLWSVESDGGDVAGDLAEKGFKAWQFEHRVLCLCDVRCGVT